MQTILKDQSTAALRRVFFHAVDATNGIDPETGLTGTGHISKRGGSPAATTNNITEIDSTDMPGRYYIELTAGEVDTTGIIEFRFKTAAIAEVVARAQIVEYDPYSASDLGLSNLNATISSRATPAQVNSQVLDVLDTDTFDELGSVPSADSSLVDKLTWLFMLARNRVTQTATTQALRDDGNSSNVATATVADDGTTAERGEWS